MKKLLTLLLAVAASAGTMFAWDYECVQIGDLYYNLDATSQTAEVTSQNSDYPYWSTTITTAIIPASVTYNSVSYSVTSIGESAFESCISLTSVTIPNSVTSIGENAFLGCSGLTSIDIPNSVTSIGRWAFYYCDGLTSVTIPNSVTSIGEGAFESCISLTSVTIPNSVTSIGYRTFYHCRSLTSINVASDNSNYCSVDGVLFNKDKTTLIQYPGGKQGAYTIPNSVTSIGYSAFFYCDGLTSIEIPNSVTSIGRWAFYYCDGLTSINVASDNSNYCSVDGVLFNKDKTTLIQYPGGKQGSYTIPNSVTSIGDGAFDDCDGLTSVTIPNSFTCIGEDAFSYCDGLTSVTIPNSVTSIGEDAFGWCSGLTSVTIGNSVTSIGDGAFSECYGLTSVTNYASTPQNLGSNVWNGVDKSTCVLYVPAGSISAYQSADVWKNFTNILPIGAQPADVTITIVTPSATTADIAWPQVTGAATYTIEIKKKGELICTLTFNAQGQLISIAFNAPSRNNAPQQTQAAGFAFTVTSLDSGTTYNYTMIAKGNNGNVLKTESGTFTTTGDAQGVEEVLSNQVPSTKILRNGQIFILRGEKAYTITGQEVK